MQRNLTIVTSSGAATFGHATAALKLIAAIVSSNNDEAGIINVTWILTVDYNLSEKARYQSILDFAAGLGVTVIYTCWRVLRQDITTTSIENTDVWLFYPYFIDLDSDSVFFHKPILNSPKPKMYITESNMLSDITGSIQTGIGPGRLGVFIEDPTQQQAPQLIYSATDNDRLLLDMLGLTDVKCYQQQNRLFFGYFNTEAAEALNEEFVNANNFCSICLHLGAMKNSKNVDIVVSLYERPLEVDFTQFASNYSAIELINHNWLVTTVMTGSDATKPKVRIIDPFPLSL